MAKKAAPELQPADLPEPQDEDINDTKSKKKEKKDKKDKKEDKKKSKQNAGEKKSSIVPIAVLLALLLGIAAVLVFNVLNIREGYVMPYLRNAPLVGSLLAPAATEEGGQAVSADNSQAVKELTAQITILESQIDKLEDDLKASEAQNAEDEETIRILRTYEAMIEEYRLIKAQFDEMVTKGDPNAYAAYYASVSPENAERLYAQVVGSISYTTEEKKLVNIYTEMSEDAAAEALEELLATNASLVTGILQNMDAGSAAAIMDEMTATNRAVVTRLLSPTAIPTQSIQPMQTAPPLSTPPPQDITEAADNP